MAISLDGRPLYNPSCPRCDHNRTWKKGFKESGNPMYQCCNCRSHFTVKIRDRKKKEESYPKEVIEASIKMYLRYLPVRQIAKKLSVPIHSVYKWINVYKESMKVNGKN